MAARGRRAAGVAAVGYQQDVEGVDLVFSEERLEEVVRRRRVCRRR